ncbi:MAG: D-alanyl-D-alanine carboxypeptidase [Methylococcaceae bacterium]|nr:D-alanyl-D-alanine carboxypeptidase [Methylococcaceae bacterium]
MSPFAIFQFRVLVPAVLSLVVTVPAFAVPYSALVAEAESERALYSRNADELRHPASLTKMMTLYMVFDAVARGELSLNDQFSTSAYAASRSPSKLGLRVGESITVEECILGLVTQSANDAATVLAEGLGGTESNFAYLMTRKAHELGMSDTVFKNASGLPDPNQITTARDMFRLGKALLKDFPQFYSYFATEHFVFRNRTFHNHNHLLDTYPGADGIKTGFVNSSGFNLVASARRDNRRLIGVVFGGPSHSRRDAHMRELLDEGFAQLEGRQPNLAINGFEQLTPPPLLRRPDSIELPKGRRAAAARTRLAALKAEAAGQGDIADRVGGRDSKPGWQVRLGEFSRSDAAQQRLSQALKTAPFALRHAQVAVSAKVQRGKKAYQASFRGISREAALAACQALRGKGIGCLPAVASR